MRRSLFPVFGAIAVSCTLASAQATRPDNELKKVLIRNVKHISSVKIDQCKLTFKRTRGASYDARQASGYVGGGFPMDESSGYLSAGPDRSMPGRMSTEKVNVDLATFKPSDIRSRPAFRLKGKTLIWLSAGGNEAERVDVGQRTAIPNGVAFIVDKKNADSTIAALKNAISRCSFDQ